MVTLQQLIDFAKEHKVEPKDCVILLHAECSNGDIELDHFDKTFLHKKVEVLNPDDEFEKIKIAIGLEQLDIQPDAPWK